MRIPFAIRVLTIPAALALLFVNLWRPWLGFPPLTGPSLWLDFSFAVIMILAGLYGGSGYYENARNGKDS